MKNLKLIVIAILFCMSSLSNAQVSVNVNLGLAPAWGPAGYSSVDYYYLPEVESYYDIRASQFIFIRNGIWIRSGYLPRMYRGYDLYNGYKVPMNNYHGSRPYTSNVYNKKNYYRGYNKGRYQKPIGNGNHYKNNGHYKNYDHDDHDNGNRYENDNEGKGKEHGNKGHKNKDK